MNAGIMSEMCCVLRFFNDIFYLYNSVNLLPEGRNVISDTLVLKIFVEHAPGPPRQAGTLWVPSLLNAFRRPSIHTICETERRG